MRENEASLRQAANGTGDENAARDALRNAGISHLQQQAGWMPSQTKRPLPQPAPAEERPLCSPQAIAYLEKVLTAKHLNMMPHWLREIYSRGERLPDEYIPIMLDRLPRTTKLRRLFPIVLHVIGARGNWLIHINQKPIWKRILDFGYEQPTYTRRMLLPFEPAAQQIDMTSATPVDDLIKQLQHYVPARMNFLFQVDWSYHAPGNSSRTIWKMNGAYTLVCAVPLQYRAEVMQLMHNYLESLLAEQSDSAIARNDARYWKHCMQRSQAMLAFRTAMNQAIHEGDEA